MVDTKLSVAYVHLVDFDDISGVSPCGSMSNLRLPEPLSHITLPYLDTKLAPSDHAASMALLEEYFYLFFYCPA